uniref:Uncharacterized protein n=1 Tax=Anopheles atroparvus TaxID=41427 RepID=A0AAG5DPY9_ANOAO
MELSDQDSTPDEPSSNLQHHFQHTSSHQHPRLIQPLPIPAAPALPPRGRSQSVDTGIIRAHANSSSWQALLEPEEAITRSEPYYCSTDSLNCATPWSSTPTPLPSPGPPMATGATSKVSCESILERIDENRPSESFPRTTGQSPHAKRRYSDHHSPLFSLTKPNVYPEKRQSEPTIRCAFYNKGFDALCPRQPPKRVLSQNDLPRAGRVLRRQISTICELNLADGSPMALGDDWRLTEMPKFRYCISDESGHCIDFDTVLPSGGLADIDDEDILRDALRFEENFVEKCAQICPEPNSLCLESIEEQVLVEMKTSGALGKGGGNGCGDKDSEKEASFDDEVIYENVKLCRKCGHQRIKL